ncbi:uncharacterized protein BX664DRAFT_386177 [Halteromyces radiatus]|uniref:uncharacterized protein n=1 Tax=Halteromyces radiatus TaxID=101107 RepID=UPI00221F61FA|nr:uncharacterized protein BX664DRAFT_386177 [Halteromyces radiatus]KAI8089740.1 hypothetical protein BX664DRAFT_386177 [Halteromyces radiatus]
MYLRVFIILLYVITLVFGYPASKFLIEIEQGISSEFNKQVMINEDIQAHYENILDEVISTHNEDFLLTMTHSMTKDKLVSYYRPQINLLLNDDDYIDDKCLYRLPHLLGKQLFDIHADTFAMVAPMVQNYMKMHWPTPEDLDEEEMTAIEIEDHLVQLNSHLMTRVNHIMMDPKVISSHLAQQLHACQQQYHPYQHGHLWKRWMIHLFGVYDNHNVWKSEDREWQDHFLFKYLMDMQQDLKDQLDTRMEDLVQILQDDLYDEFVDY